MNATLTLLQDPRTRVDHDGVTYSPLPSDAALGALLFALAPEGVDLAGSHADRVALRGALDAARQFARLLERHAARADRGVPRWPDGLDTATARGWMLAAGDAVPASEHERFAWRVVQRLGENPWADGSPAIELANQQFGLFAAKFDEVDTPDQAQEAVETPPEAPAA